MAADWQRCGGSGSLAAMAAAVWQRQLGGGSLATAVAEHQHWQQRLGQHCNSMTAMAAMSEAWRQRGGGSLMAAGVAWQWWQQKRWQHCNSATAVAAVMAALRQQLCGGTAAAAWCWLQQRCSGSSSCVSSSVTVPRWWRGIGSLFDFAISLLVASLGGIGCGLEGGWYFGSPFISPWLTK